MQRRTRIAWLLALALLAGLGYGIYYGIVWPRHLHRDWRIADVIRLSRPDSLALGPDGHLQYVTLETIPGFLVQLTPDGPKTVFGDFGEPDGLLLLDDSVMVSEEDAGGRVLLYNFASAKLRVLARLDYPEGLLQLPDGRLLVSQDVPQGRVVTVTPDGQTSTLVEGLDQPEGLCLMPDGRVAIAESGSGRILAFGPAGLQVFAEDLEGIDQIACGDDGSVWVVQSAVRSGRLVRIKDGRRRLIMSHLREPQGVALAADGSVYLAETRANRVLHLKPRVTP
jgi:sugar lactone lactonase YvrE